MISKNDRMTFLADGFLVRDRMSPDLLARWRSAFHAEVKHRGGVVEGQLYHRDVANGVLREIIERASRRYRDELVPRVRKHMTRRAGAYVSGNQGLV